MNCDPTANYILLGLSLFLLAIAAAGLWYSIHNARRVALADALLDACDGDWDAATLEVENARIEAELIRRGGFSPEEYAAMLGRLETTTRPPK